MSGRWDTLVEPTEEEYIREWIEHHLDQVHGPFLARVQAYDRERGTVDVVPLVRHAVRDADGGYTHEDLPVIPCCPVAWPRAGGHFVAFALQPGDLVVCLTMTNAYGHWWAGDGSVQDPGDLRRHHIANSIALPLSVHPRQGALRNAPRHQFNERLRIGDDSDGGTRVTFMEDGTYRMTRGADTAFQVDPDRTVHLGGAPAATKPLAVAELVDALAQSLKNHIATWVPVPTDGGASLKAHIAAWSPPSVAATKTRGV